MTSRPASRLPARLRRGRRTAWRWRESASSKTRAAPYPSIRYAERIWSRRRLSKGVFTLRGDAERSPASHRRVSSRRELPAAKPGLACAGPHLGRRGYDEAVLLAVETRACSHWKAMRHIAPRAIAGSALDTRSRLQSQIWACAGPRLGRRGYDEAVCLLAIETRALTARSIRRNRDGDGRMGQGLGSFVEARAPEPGRLRRAGSPCRGDR